MTNLPSISLCITTMNRYKDFLSKFLYKYLDYDLFNEIIIVDENGLDKYLLDQNYKDHPKLKTYTNDKRLGAFKNKLKAISLATNDWVFLLDSDNFIAPDFVKTLTTFIESREALLDEKVIYTTEYALHNWRPNPGMNFSHLKGLELDKGTVKHLCLSDFSKMEFYLNMGNYLLHKSVLDYDYAFWDKQIEECKCYDAIFFIYMMLYRKGMRLNVVPGLRINYAIHEDSYFLPNHSLDGVKEFYKQLLHLIANE